MPSRPRSPPFRVRFQHACACLPATPRRRHLLTTVCFARLFCQAHSWPAAAETKSHLSRRRRVSCCAVRVPCAFSYPCMPHAPGHLSCSAHHGPKLPVFMRTLPRCAFLPSHCQRKHSMALTGSHSVTCCHICLPTPPHFNACACRPPNPPLREFRSCPRTPCEAYLTAKPQRLSLLTFLHALPCLPNTHINSTFLPQPLNPPSMRVHDVYTVLTCTYVISPSTPPHPPPAALHTSIPPPLTPM
jgi:hypothetical protein